MAIFNIIFFKIFSSLLSVVLGFWAGKSAGVKKDGIVTLLFYFIVPIVYFAIPASASLKPSDFGITLITFVITSGLSCFAYWFNRKIWKNLRPNILAFSAGTCNSSYLGIPIAAVIFDEHGLGIFVLASIGVAIYEVVVGFYFCARSQTTIYETLLKIAKLPIFSAFILGCTIGLSDFTLPDFFDEFVTDMRSTFSILGMMLIGLALSCVDDFKFNYKFIGSAFFSKFVLYPLAFNLFIILDQLFFGWYDSSYYNVLQLLCIMPLASSTILFSSLFNLYSEEMATAAVLAMIFALLYIPAVSSFLLQ